MKKILLIASLLTGGYAFAQPSANLKLKKGQTITAVSVVTSDMDMGMMGAMKNDITAYSKLEVTDDTKDAYAVSNTVTRMKMSMDGMGQNMNFDSDNPSDMSGQMGQTMGENINKPILFSINKNTGEVTKSEKSEGGGGSGMMMGGGDESQMLADMFVNIPAGAKPGQSWETSFNTKGLTTKKKYTIKSMMNDLAVVTISGTTQGTTEQDMQGTPINVTMSMTFDGMSQVDMKTGLVKESQMNMTNNSSMDMMGQQMEINAKTNSKTTYTF
jgi:hypothetical protein